MKLKDYRHLNDLSSSEFGLRIGVSSRAVRMYEAGDRVPKPSVMAKIQSETFGEVTANDFHPFFLDEQCRPSPALAFVRRK